MSHVINDVVKMNWEKAKWLQTKKGSFIMAGVTYQKPDGTEVDVIFTVNEAFVWGEDNDLWTAEEVIAWFKSEHLTPSDSLDAYEDYCKVAGVDEVVDSVVARLGLEAYADDIRARLNDLSEYGVEQEFKM